MGRVRSNQRWEAYVWAAGLVGLATVVGTLGRGRFFPTAALMLYLVAIGVTAARFGRAPSLFASALSVAASAFFFLPPIFSFAVEDARHTFTFALMFASALLTSGLSLELRRQGIASRDKDAETAALYALSRELVAAPDERQVASIASRHLAGSLRGAAAVLLGDEQGSLNTLASFALEKPLSHADMMAARTAMDQRQITGRGTDLVSNANATCLPLLTDGGPIGVLISSAGQVSRIARDQRRFLKSFAQHTAVALDRVRMAGREQQALLRARTEELRSSLLSAVSHDLRTPLGSILGAATTLRDHAASLSECQRAELLDSVCAEAERLARLVANLLELSRLDAGSAELNREWVPLDELVGAALTRMERVLMGRRVETDLPSDVLLVPVDPVLIEQVLLNLLDNADKHTAAGTPITISGRNEGSVIVVEVSDRGPGLPAGQERQILEKFVRGRPATRPGAGLGLAVCRGIIAAHGGTLDATNRPGGGATFRFGLPLVGTPPALSPEAPEAALGRGSLDGGAPA